MPGTVTILINNIKLTTKNQLHQHAHNLAVMKLGKINVYAGTDIEMMVKETVNQFAKRDINLITKLRPIVKKYAHGITSMKDNGINV